MKTILVGLCLLVRVGFCQVPQNNNGTVYKGFVLFLPAEGPGLSVTKNPGMLGVNREGFLAVQSEQRFTMKELALHQLVAVFPTDHGSLLATLSQFGSTLFNQSTASLSYGGKLNRVSIGIQFDYQVQSLSGLGRSSKLGAGAGIHWEITDRVQTGISMLNPGFQNRAKSESMMLPFNLNWFLTIVVSEQAGLGVQVEKQETNPPVISLGCLYKPAPKIACRVGMLTNGFSPWLSIGYLVKKWSIDLFSTYHLQLGVSPGIIVVYKFKTVEK